VSKFIDETGHRYGSWTCLKYVGKRKWLCKCDCGTEKVVYISALRRNDKCKSTSCGCKKETFAFKNRDDIRCRKLYYVWNNIKCRCYCKTTPNYNWYGGKGITMCDEWRNDFETFYNWAINNGYEYLDDERKNRLQIDRIDSSKGYCPENCRWITSTENSSRTSKTNAQLEEIMLKTNDELVKEYIERKMEHNLELQKMKKEIREGWFPCKRNNYCCLKSDEKQFLFKSYVSVAMFLNIKAPQVSYRVNRKNGYINDIWHLKKITKEEFDKLSRNVEVIV